MPSFEDIEQSNSAIFSSQPPTVGSLTPPNHPLQREEVGSFFDTVISKFKKEDDEGRLDRVARVDFLYKATATVAYHDITFSVKVKDKKIKKVADHTILQPVSGTILPGELVAIMGPSGCGKSTLLDILAGKKSGGYGGTIYLNGRPRDKLYDLITAHVPQNDVMPEQWLVKEAVKFNILLRRPMPKIVERENIKKMLQMSLKALGLWNVKDTRIGGPTVRGISGGQRRRVALARGLAMAPHILFCDEPTSGLSSTDAENVIRRLKSFSIRTGMSAAVVIHQPKPELVALFDKLALLTSEPGRVVYNGRMSDAFAHFEAVGFPVPVFSSPADHFISMVSPGFKDQKISEFVAYYNTECATTVAAEVHDQISNPGMSSSEVLERSFGALEAVFGDLAISTKRVLSGSPYVAPVGTQFVVVFSRAVSLMLRNKWGLLRELIASVVKALVLGIAFLGIYDQVPLAQVGFIFILCQMEVITLVQSMGPSIEMRTIMKYEVSDRLYRDEVFILSMTIVDIFKFLALNIVYVTIAFALSGFEWRHFGIFYAWELLTCLTFQSFFQMVAAIGKTATEAHAIAQPIYFLFVLFNGYFVTKATVVFWMEWAIYISPLFYFINQVSVALFLDGTPRYIFSEDGEKVVNPAYLDSGQYVIDYYRFRDMQTIAVFVLLCEIILFRVLQVVFLKKLNNPDR